MVIETYRGTLTEDLNLRGVLLIDLIWCCGEWNHVDRDLLTRAVEIVCHGTVERQGISPKGKIFSDLFYTIVVELGKNMKLHDNEVNATM